MVIPINIAGLATAALCLILPSMLTSSFTLSSPPSLSPFPPSSPFYHPTSTSSLPSSQDHYNYYPFVTSSASASSKRRRSTLLLKAAKTSFTSKELLELIENEEKHGSDKVLKLQAEEDGIKLKKERQQQQQQREKLQIVEYKKRKPKKKKFKREDFEMDDIGCLILDDETKLEAESEGFVFNWDDDIGCLVLDAIPEDALVSSLTTTEAAQSVVPSSSFIGRTLLNGKYTIEEQFRIGSMKCEIFIAYDLDDKKKRRPVAVKLTNGYPQYIDIEYKVYNDLYKRLGNKEASKYFIKVYDWIPESSDTDERCGFLMDCGYENLRSYMFRNGPFSNKALLKMAMRHVISIVNSLHKIGLVWTECKSENLIVMYKTDGDSQSNMDNLLNGNIDISTFIKGADLESICGHQDHVRIYSAEGYPPEFPVDDLYNGQPPKIPLEYSFDVWGLGMILYEMLVGEPVLTLQKCYDVEYIRNRLRNPQNFVDEIYQKLDKLGGIEEGAIKVVKKCIVVSPKHRSSCEDLLNDDYFK